MFILKSDDQINYTVEDLIFFFFFLSFGCQMIIYRNIFLCSSSIEKRFTIIYKFCNFSSILWKVFNFWEASKYVIFFTPQDRLVALLNLGMFNVYIYFSKSFVSWFYSTVKFILSICNTNSSRSLRWRNKYSLCSWWFYVVAYV